MLREWSEDRFSIAEGHFKNSWHDTRGVNDWTWSLTYDLLYKADIAASFDKV